MKELEDCYNRHPKQHLFTKQHVYHLSSLIYDLLNSAEITFSSQLLPPPKGSLKFMATSL
ncbi:hypothetical protein TNCV_4949371, partial [Trichonephila clavipes]